MTIREINAFARRTGNDKQFEGRRVVIKREDGQYLCRTEPDEIGWTPDKSRAFIYEYTADKVGQQLEQVELEYGAKWEVEIA